MLSLPRTDLPSVNAPSSLTRNQVPNSAAFVRARHTRVRGARSATRFSIRSVLTVSVGASVLIAIGRSSPETGRTAVLRYATLVLRIIHAIALKRNPAVALSLGRRRSLTRPWDKPTRRAGSQWFSRSERL